MKGCIYLIISFVFFTNIAAANLMFDSLRLEKKEGSTFIKHRIDAGETLYSISSKYNILVKDLLKANPGLDSKEIPIGLILSIPYFETINNSPQVSTDKKEKIHTVKPSETLYAIAIQHKVSVSEIKKWNNLLGNDIKVGQKLIVSYSNSSNIKTESKIIGKNAQKQIEGHVVKPGETLYAISRIYDIEIADIKKWNKIDADELTVGQILRIKEKREFVEHKNVPRSIKLVDRPFPENEIVHEPIASKDKSSNHLYEVENISYTGDLNNLVERGLAELIDESAGTQKHLALHRTAPVGTIIKVVNQMNNSSVFVRVIGKLLNMDNNDQVIIKISKTAFDRLGAIGKRFPVEISYIP